MRVLSSISCAMWLLTGMGGQWYNVHLCSVKKNILNTIHIACEMGVSYSACGTIDMEWVRCTCVNRIYMEKGN